VRVAFDVTSCAKPRRGGIATYGWELIAACARIASQHEYSLLVRPHHWFARQHLDDLARGVAQATGRPEASLRPRLLLEFLPGQGLGDAEVLHSIGVRLPPRGRSRALRVVTLHDINVFEFPELSDARWRERRQARILQTIARADRVIVTTRTGATVLDAHLAVPQERVCVVPMGVDTARFRPLPPEAVRPVLERHTLAGRPYVLHVGAFSVRKNQRGLLAAFARASLPKEWVLVLGGPVGEHAEALRQEARALGLPDERVRLPGWLSDSDYPALLCGAAFVVCASLHEGFGMPVIEAQACGAPVLSSHRGALPETVGEAGVLFDPTDTGVFAAALVDMAGDAALRARLAAAGPPRVAQHFTWDRIARQTLEVYAGATPSPV
jgi:glycosyltransferase involved in cell wall biosynthesis